MSNPHATTAEQLANSANGWNIGYETADAQHIVGYLEANMQASLAIAYEQRTANLLAWLAAPYVEATLDNIAVADAIKERLGLA